MTFRELREQRGFKNGSALARRAGVEQTTVSQLELGKVGDPRWSTLKALAGALRVSPATVAKAIAETYGVAA